MPLFKTNTVKLTGDDIEKLVIGGFNYFANTDIDIDLPKKLNRIASKMENWLIEGIQLERKDDGFFYLTVDFDISL